MYSVQDTAEAVGFPIRKSADQSLFAAPRGLSQRTTSFIASQRQGIHRTPLKHLITLIVDARRRLVDAAARQEKRPVFFEFCPTAAVNSAVCIGCGDFHRHTRTNLLFTMSKTTRLRRDGGREFMLIRGTAHSPPSPLRATARQPKRSQTSSGLPSRGALARRLVEPDGIEPTTSCLQSRRSPN